ncbi:hypothetical protein DOY81_005332, partial [Sarcophaga bullata]
INLVQSQVEVTVRNDKMKLTVGVGVTIGLILFAYCDLIDSQPLVEYRKEARQSYAVDDYYYDEAEEDQEEEDELQQTLSEQNDDISPGGQRENGNENLDELEEDDNEDEEGDDEGEGDDDEERFMTNQMFLMKIFNILQT